MNSEVIVDMPGLCVDGRLGIVVGFRDYPAEQKRPAERRYVVELAPALDDEPLHLYLRREELIHAAW